MSAPNQTLTIETTKSMPAVDKARLQRLHTQMLIKLGLRSRCCGGKIVTWHHDKFYCDTCDGWLSRAPVK